jgi:anti-repressor protein
MSNATMMNEVQIFRNNRFGNAEVIRGDDGEPWFVAKVVAEALGYPASSLNQVGNLMGAVPQEWKSLKRIKLMSDNGVKQQRKVLCLSEPGLYFFLTRSNKPKALPFQKWIAGEVLPAIRKTGGYIPVAEQDTDLEIMAKALKIMDRTVKEMRTKIETDAPKVAYAESVEEARTAISVSTMAKLIKQACPGTPIGGNRLFAFLRKNKYLCADKGRKNMPTQHSMDRGWMKVKQTIFRDRTGITRVQFSPRITGKGQIYFMNLFLNKNRRGVDIPSG